MQVRAAGQKGGRHREVVARAFQGVAGADVALLPHRVEEVQTYEQTRDHFLDTMARTRNAPFCLVPRGYTASSRRFYEAPGGAWCIESPRRARCLMHIERRLDERREAALL